VKYDIRIISSPGGPTWSVVEAMTLPEATVLFPNRGKTTGFTSLVDRSGDPVDFWVAADLIKSPASVPPNMDASRKRNKTDNFV
jgi:hypothetical protein